MMNLFKFIFENSNMKLSLFVVVLLLTGCATSQQVATPGGAPAHLIKCGNLAKSACTQKAVDLCPSGYTELERKPDTYGDTTKVGNMGLLEIRADTTTFMLVQCK
jgi:hypothetical protein